MGEAVYVTNGNKLVPLSTRSKEEAIRKKVREMPFFKSKKKRTGSEVYAEDVWLKDIYDDENYAIVEAKGKLFKVLYEMDGTEAKIKGEPVEVVVTYVPVKQD